MELYGLADALPLFLCKGKRPKAKGWPDSELVEEDDVKKWNLGGGNLAMVTGRRSGVVVIDLDGETAVENFKKIFAGRFPKTPIVRTPSGGFHVYFKAPEEGFPTRRIPYSKDHDELAIQGDGAYVVVPPSVGENGKSYTWKKGRSPLDIKLAPLPVEVIRLFSEEKVDEILECSEVIACSGIADLKERVASGAVTETELLAGCRFYLAAGDPQAAEVLFDSHPEPGSKAHGFFEKLKRKAAGEGLAWPRCTSLGCTPAQVRACFGTVRMDDEGKIKNNPRTKAQRFKPLGGCAPQKGQIPVRQRIEKALLKEGYTFDDRGYLCKIAGDRLQEICRAFGYPTACDVYHTPDGLRRMYTIEGFDSEGNPCPAVTLEEKEFEAMDWLSKSWGHHCRLFPTFNASRLAADAFLASGLPFSTSNFYQVPGWHVIDQSWIYFHGDGAIGGEYKTNFMNPFNIYRLPNDVKNPNRVFRTFMRLYELAPPSVIVPLISLTFLSSMVTLFKEAGHEPQFLMWLYGETGVRKTTISKIFMSFFGPFANAAPLISFKDTAASIEYKCSYLRDVLVLVDDYHPTESLNDARQMEKRAQDMLRLFGDRVGKGRMKMRMAMQDTYAPRSMVIVTGEDVPRGSSSTARLFFLELRGTDVNCSILGELQKKSSDLCSVMSLFLQYLQPQVPELILKLGDMFLDTREGFIDQNLHGRLPEMAAWLHCAYGLLIDFLLREGVIDKKNKNEMVRQSHRILKEALEKQMVAMRAVDPVEIFLENVAEMLEIGRIKLKSRTTGGGGSVGGEFCGWLDDDYCYLLPSTTFSMVNRALSAKNQRFPLTERRLWKMMADRGHLKINEGGDRKYNTIKIHVREGDGINESSAKTVRVLALKKTSLMAAE